TFTLIATEGGLLSRPEPERKLVFLSPAQREDIVVDFSRFATGTVLYLENRLDQPDGRGPKGDFERPEILGSGPRFLKIIVGADADDPSQVPDTLRHFEAISADEIRRARRRRFEFERSGGVWVINGRRVDLERSVADVPRNEPEVWTLK